MTTPAWAERVEQTEPAPASVKPAPFIRWAGSKRWLIPTLARIIPESFGTYYEPFLGSGSLFFWLEPRRALLSDTLRPLVETYETVRDSPALVLASIQQWPLESQTFYTVRGATYSDAPTRAAQFIYLNKACFNGLYRVNRAGRFNVPFGRPKTDTTVNVDSFLAASSLLATADLECQDFAAAVEKVARGDLVFLDPPYAGQNGQGFTEYNEELFQWQDQLRLAKMANDLARRGAHVIVTNRHDDRVRTLYSSLFEAAEVTRTSTVAANPARRGTVKEMLLTANLKG
jgi:DNA adenine methylase